MSEFPKIGGGESVGNPYANSVENIRELQNLIGNNDRNETPVSPLVRAWLTDQARIQGAESLMATAPGTWFNCQQVIEHFTEEVKKQNQKILRCEDEHVKKQLVMKRDFSQAIVNYTKVAQLFEVQKVEGNEGEK